MDNVKWLTEERTGLCASFLYVARVKFCPFFLPLGVRGLAVACDCNTSWNFLLTFLHSQSKVISIFSILWRFSISQNGALWQSIVATLVLPKELYDTVKWESANFLHTHSCKNSLSCHHLWASSRENLSSVVCDQERLKLACSASETS